MDTSGLLPPAPFSKRRLIYTAAADSFPSDTILSSQDAVKIRGLTQMPSESLGSFAGWERQNSCASLHPNLTSGWNTDGLWITLLWTGFDGRKISLHGQVLAKHISDWEIRTSGLFVTRVGLHSAHNYCFPWPLDAVLHATSTAGVHLGGFGAPALEGEGSWWGRWEIWMESPRGYLIAMYSR